MAISAKTMRAQLARLSPLLKSCSLETIRKGQDMLGELTEAKYKKRVITKEHSFENFKDDPMKASHAGGTEEENLVNLYVINK